MSPTAKVAKPSPVQGQQTTDDFWNELDYKHTDSPTNDVSIEKINIDCSSSKAKQCWLSKLPKNFEAIGYLSL